VTVEWLRVVTGYAVPGPQPPSGIGWLICDGQPVVYLYGLSIIDSDRPMPRRDFRELCRILGIQLKEQA